jgi:hypothetical protein
MAGKAVRRDACRSAAAWVIPRIYCRLVAQGDEGVCRLRHALPRPVVIDRTTDPSCDRETWTPSTLPTGIAASADLTLAARAASDAVSLSRR